MTAAANPARVARAIGIMVAWQLRAAAIDPSGAAAEEIGEVLDVLTAIESQQPPRREHYCHGPERCDCAEAYGKAPPV